MRIHTRAIISVLLLLICQSLWAEAVEYATFFQQVFAKIASGFSYQLSEAEQSQEIVWMYPALPLSPVSTPVKVEEYFQYAQVLNPVLNRGVFLSARSELLPDVYAFILNSAIVGDSPMTVGEAKQFAQARETLFVGENRFSPRYEAYWQYRAAYEEALCALYAARANESPDAPRLRAEVNSALQAWEAKGYRRTIEAVLADYRTLLPKDKSWWQALRMRLDDGKRSAHGGTFYLTETQPPIGKWETAGSWYDYQFDSREAKTPSQSPVPLPRSTSAFVANPAAQKAITQIARQSVNVSTSSVSCAAAAARTLTDAKATAVMENLRISVKLKRINIVRPWLAEDIFASRNWKLGTAYKDTLFSTGDPANTRTPERLPVLVVGVLLAKDLEIQGTVGKETLNTLLEASALLEQANPGASIGLGPFCIAGKPLQGAALQQDLYNVRRDERLRPGGFTRPYVNVSTALENRTEIRLAAPGVQILGYFVKQLPRCPDPAPDVAF